MLRMYPRVVKALVAGSVHLTVMEVVVDTRRVGAAGLLGVLPNAMKDSTLNSE